MRMRIRIPKLAHILAVKLFLSSCLDGALLEHNSCFRNAKGELVPEDGGGRGKAVPDLIFDLLACWVVGGGGERGEGMGVTELRFDYDWGWRGGAGGEGPFLS